MRADEHAVHLGEPDGLVHYGEVAGSYSVSVYPGEDGAFGLTMRGSHRRHWLDGWFSLGLHHRPNRLGQS